MAGVLRGDGRVKAVLNTDAGNLPWQAANGVRAGNNGSMQFFVGPALAFVVPCLVVEVNYTSQVAGKVEWEGSVKLNAEAGAYSYPS